MSTERRALRKNKLIMLEVERGDLGIWWGGNEEGRGDELGDST